MLQKQLVLVDIIRYNYNILWLECDYSAHQWFTEAVHGGLSRKAGRYGIYRVVRVAETPHLSQEEILSFLDSRRGLLDGVVLSGGEPLLQPDAAEFLRAVRSMGFAVKLDTNGCHPEALADILRQGLADYVAMDIKNCREKYAGTVGVPDFDLAPVEESIQLLCRSGVEFEFRTTVVREFHTAADITAIGRWLEGSPQYFLQKFVDSGDLVGSGCHAPEDEEMRAMADAARPWFQAVALRGID